MEGRDLTEEREWLADRFDEARRRVQGADPLPEVNLTAQREAVGAFIAAARRGDFQALVARSRRPGSRYAAAR